MLQSNILYRLAEIRRPKLEENTLTFMPWFQEQLRSSSYWRESHLLGYEKETEEFYVETGFEWSEAAK